MVVEALHVEGLEEPDDVRGYLAGVEWDEGWREGVGQGGFFGFCAVEGGEECVLEVF